MISVPSLPCSAAKGWWRQSPRLCRSALAILAISAATAMAAEPLTSVADLRYGVALYEYYQGHNVDALSELMVAQKQGGIQGHGDNPEIMEGGFAMAYGMERKASDIFTRLLDGNRPQRTRDAAWFYLAQMRYLRGDWPGAEQALAQVSEKPDPALKPEVTALRFNVAIQQEQLSEAAAILESAGQLPDWRPYMQYNLGTAYSRAGDFTRGVDHLEQLLEMKERSPEHLALYDKAMTAAGYAYLLQQNYPRAIEYFTQVRLDSPLSNRALLGYGWAAVEQGDYKRALKPWLALAERPLVDQYSQEALVAIPYAYEKLGLQKQALEKFRQAESSYLAELDLLQQAMNDIEGYAIREALELDRSEDFSWLEYAQDNQLAPRTTYLVDLFAREEFIGLVQEVRDLLAIQERFSQWQNTLDFYSQMLDEREANRAQEVDYLAQQDISDKVQAMVEERNQLAAQVQQLEGGTDYLALVNPQDDARLTRILRAEKNIQILQAAARDRGVHVMAAEELAQLAETLRRQKGLMLWDAAQMYDERLWRAQRELALVDEQIQQIVDLQRRVSDIAGQGLDLQPYRQRIARANEQLISQTVEIDLAIEQAQDALRAQVMDILQEQDGRMSHYLAQARLSIARLLDLSADPESSSDAGAASAAVEVGP